MSELPENWVLTTVGEVATLLRGVSYQKKQAEAIESDKNCLVLRGGNIQDGKIFIGDDVVYVSKDLISENQFIKKGDVVIVGSTGSKELIGKAALSLQDEDKIAFGAFLMLLRPSEEISKKYFGYFFLTREYRNSIRESSAGVNINNIRREHITSMSFPLPPLPEQKRILAKLDNLFAHLDQLKARLQNIPTLLKRFRQAVLTQGVTGKLTKEWRNGKSFVETGLQLLQRIEKEVIGESKAKLPRGYKGHEYLIEYDQFDLPKEWSLSVIDKIGIVQIGGTPSRAESSYWNGNIKWVSSGEVDNSRIKSTNESITKMGLESSSVKVLPKGAVLVAMIGEGKTRGQSSILEIEAGTNQNVAAIVTKKNHFNPEFLWFFMLANYEKNRGEGRGANQPALNGQKVGAINIPIPPLEEQTEIVRRIESLFAVADRIDANYYSLNERIDHLPQAILSKAFKGELAEQNPNDGNASDLLKHIEQSREGVQEIGQKKERKPRKIQTRKVQSDTERPQAQVNRSISEIPLTITLQKEFGSKAFKFEDLKNLNTEYNSIKNQLFEILDLSTNSKNGTRLEIESSKQGIKFKFSES